MKERVGVIEMDKRSVRRVEEDGGEGNGKKVGE